MSPEAKHDSRTVQISLIWIIILCLFVILLGMVGSFIAQQLLNPAKTPLIKNLQPLVTNVQQVTISPSSQGAKIVKTAQRSVVLLAQPNGKNGDYKFLNSGLIITNDGLIVTATIDAQNPTVAIDDDGHINTIDKIGSDSVYGLSYYRLHNGIFAPLSLVDSDAPVAAQFLIVSHSPATLQPVARPFFFTEYIPADTTQPAGIQQIAQGTQYADSSFLIGSPVMSDEGKVAGLVLNPENGAVIPASALRASLDRVANEKREFDPFVTLGFTPHYAYTLNSTTHLPTFSVSIANVKPNSIAATAGLKNNDSIVGIDNKNVTADSNLVDMLSHALPFTISITRDGQAQVLAVSNPATTSVSPVATITP